MQFRCFEIFRIVETALYNCYRFLYTKVRIYIIGHVSDIKYYISFFYDNIFYFR